MQCYTVKKLLNLYIDEELNEKSMNSIQVHLDSCEECRLEYNELLYTKRLLENMPPLELPDNFGETLHSKLVEEKKKLDIMHNRRRSPKGIFAIAAAVITSIFVLSFGFNFLMNNINDRAFKGSSETSLNTKSAANYSTEASTGGKEAAPNLKNDVYNGLNQINRGLDSGYERKITKDAVISIETNSVDEGYDKILNISKQYNGYIESTSENTSENGQKTINIVLKIPADDFEYAISNIKSLGHVKTIRINSSDITEQYYDVQARIKNLEIQEESLQSLMKKASNISDILQIEDKLNDVQTQIDSYKSQIKLWDSMTNMSTINLTFLSVVPQSAIGKIFDESFFKDVLNAGAKSLNVFFEFIKYVIVIIIYLLPFAMLIYLAYKGYRLFKK